MENKIVQVDEYGTAYFINVYGEFAGYPLLANGEYDLIEMITSRSASWALSSPLRMGVVVYFEWDHELKLILDVSWKPG